MEKTCVICCHEVEFLCVGACNHIVCFECIARIRSLCTTDECPICRNELDEVFMVKFLKPYDDLMKRKAKFISDDPVGRQYGFIFENEQCRRAFRDILSNYCPIEDCNQGFQTFDALKDHVRKQHGLYYCDLCLESLKLFPWERRCYTRSELARHRREGDPDDRSHRGHPLCNFCDARYVDTDVLYSTYIDLRGHFVERHFLCEEGECKNEQLTNAYNNEIDFKAHKASVHANTMNKAQLKQERALNLEFNYGNSRQEMMQRRSAQAGTSRTSSQNQAGPNRDREFRESSGRGRLNDAKGKRLPGKPVRQANQNSENIPIENGSSQRQAFVVKNPEQEFPTLGPDGSKLEPGVPLGQRLMVTAVTHGPSPLSRTGGIDVNEFPSLDHTSVPSQQIPGASSNNVSDSILPKKPVKKGIVMIDSDDFPSLPGLVAPSQPPPGSMASQRMTQPASAATDQQVLEPDHVSLKDLSFSNLLDGPTSSQRGGNSLWDAKAKDRDLPGLADSSAFPGLESGGKKIRGFGEIKNNANSNGAWKSQSSRPAGSVNISGRTEAFEAIEFPDTPKQKSKPKVAVSSHQFESLPKTQAKKMKTRPLDEPANPPQERATSPRKHVSRLDENVEHQKSSIRSRTPPPPGFSRPVENGHLPNEPPGSDNTPPPGFGQPLDSIKSGGVYIKPPDFTKRNQLLFLKLERALNTQSLSEFKIMSGRFRRGQIDATEFYLFVYEHLGSRLFHAIFGDLLILLPNIDRQHKLLEAHLALEKGRWSGAALDFQVCPRCAQLLIRDDTAAHERLHQLAESGEFPALD